MEGKKNQCACCQSVNDWVIYLGSYNVVRNTDMQLLQLL